MWPLRCFITLDKPSHIYFVGEKVTGQLTLVLGQASSIQKMNLHIVGVASVFPSSVSFEFERLTKSVELNKILPSGKHAFPISWILPMDLISSYKWKTACVSYAFHADVEVSGGQMKAPPPLPFDLFNCIDLNTLPPAVQRPSVHNASCVVRNSRTSSGQGAAAVTFLLDFVVDRQCYIPGEWLKFTCAVTYDTPESSEVKPKKFPGIRVTLEQVMTYLNKGQEVSTTSIVWTKTGHGVRSNETSLWEDRMKIPGSCQSTPVESYGVICVQYWLTVTASLMRESRIRRDSNTNNNNQSPQLKIPIVVGSIGLDQLGGSTMSFGLSLTNIQQRPTTTSVPSRITSTNINNDDDDYEYGDAEDQETPTKYCDLEDRPETPPPSYEEAVNIFERFPPPYRLVD